MSILVTGGGGYIGSHMVSVLQQAQLNPIVIDNFSTGHRSAVSRDVPLLEADISEQRKVAEFMRDHQVHAVLHFASFIQVGESVSDPKRYYANNLAASLTFLESVLAVGIKYFILSSTAAVYGNPSRVPIAESEMALPINPYGETKLALERALAAYHNAYGLSYAALRYFNAAGAAPERGLGERHEPESHLIPIVLDVAMNKRPFITIYGDDYDTPDGTCVRDYIHVLDLADAHLAALSHLESGGSSGAFNLGTGNGHSVREVLDVAGTVTGRTIPCRIGPRRAGDPASLVASPKLAEQEFGWKATRSSLERIIRDAWQWQAFSAREPSRSVA